MTDATMSSINVRIPKAEKELAVAKLRNSGMDLPTAINIFIKQVIRQEKFPVEIYTEYRFPNEVYHRLDEATANRKNAKYLTVEECFGSWDEVISEVENGEI